MSEFTRSCNVPKLPLKHSKECRWSLNQAADEFQLPLFPSMIRHFLYQQLNSNSSTSDPELRPHEVSGCHSDTTMINIVYLAVTTFCAPSDPSGITGMHREHIRATPSWRGTPRFDFILVSVDSHLQGMLGLEVACIQAF